VEEGNLKQYISHLRKALDDNSDDTRLIVTIARKGYQFTARVTPDTTIRTGVQVSTVEAGTQPAAPDLPPTKRLQKRQVTGGKLP